MQRIFTAHSQLEGGGFQVTRPFPSAALPDMDPFLLFDQMGPIQYAPGEAVGAPDHPHRGFETVTYVLEGEMVHEDSQGNASVLGPGHLQWMTAGSGVIHSEMPTPRFQETGGTVHGVQLWINLPAEKKMMAPRYQDLKEELPRIDVPGGWIKIISGSQGDVAAHTKTEIPIQYLHVHLQDGKATVDIPDVGTRFAYVLSGNGTIDGESIKAGQIILLPAGTIAISGNLDALVLSGKPIREPIARYGPFVMNTHEEIVQAVRDYQSGQFGTIKRTGPIAVHGQDPAPFGGVDATDDNVRSARLLVVAPGTPAMHRVRQLAASSGVTVVETNDPSDI